ncbi:hypothetical protein [Pseudoalteromonas sp. ECSMB14103]|uniref:hypothetical protein n=1 Tax=Pseudoalteromonas sp. ECSMB14103 TaxID=1580062 RepID=UPI00057B75B2|nr:hypothetical protein [Pseudoalteromonas sp. ECSMB14103]
MKNLNKLFDLDLPHDVKNKIALTLRDHVQTLLDDEKQKLQNLYKKLTVTKDEQTIDEWFKNLV